MTPSNRAVKEPWRQIQPHSHEPMEQMKGDADRTDVNVIRSVSLSKKPKRGDNNVPKRKTKGLDTIQERFQKIPEKAAHNYAEKWENLLC